MVARCAGAEVVLTNKAVMKLAHPQPTLPGAWHDSSANPERSYTLLNKESPEFIRFVNPSDYRVAREACGACHLEVIEATCAKHGLSFELTPTADFPPLYFDQGCVEAVRGAAVGLGLSHMDIVSGAGHDAIFLAELGPAGMIFVPCEGGISHNEIENAAPTDLADGCAVLLRAMLAASAALAKGKLAA